MMIPFNVVEYSVVFLRCRGFCNSLAGSVFSGVASAGSSAQELG
jgi:hypothetical protein